MLFAVPARKDAEGSEAWNPEGIAQRALRALRDDLGDDAVMMSRPLPGRVHRPRALRRADADGEVDNDATLERYARIAARRPRPAPTSWDPAA